MVFKAVREYYNKEQEEEGTVVHRELFQKKALRKWCLRNVLEY
jgi:hypothetical protein